MKFWSRVILSVLFIFQAGIASAALGQTLDFAYYLGLVSTDGGTTINDQHWIKYGVEGQDIPDLDGSSYFPENTSEARAVIATNNGYTLIARWYKNGNWILDGADIFKVTADTILWFGEYVFDDGSGGHAELLDAPLAIKRQMTVGETQTFNATAQGGVTNIAQSITVLETGVTVASFETPAGTDFTNAARVAIQLIFGTDEVESMLTTMIPGRGEAKYIEAEIDAADTTTPVEYFSANNVAVWSNSGSLPSEFNQSGELTALKALTASTVTMPADSPSVKPSGRSGVVVIPLF